MDGYTVISWPNAATSLPSPQASGRAAYVICTVPFSVLRPIEASFSREKERAIRQLNYHASTKILLQVRDRFWEQEDGIVGGASVTDLPIRRLNYPPADPSTSVGPSRVRWAGMSAAMGSPDEVR